MKDTSLEDFLESGNRREDGDTTDRDDGAPTADVKEVTDDGATSATGSDPTVTASWTPAGDVCQSCGDEVEWRWRGEGGLVCPDCKDW